MEYYTKEVQEKLNKYGCKPSEDVCMKHQQPLIDFGFCEYAPNVKEYIATLLTEARKKWLEEEIEKVRKLYVYSDEYGNYPYDPCANQAIDEICYRLEAELKALDK